MYTVLHRTRRGRRLAHQRARGADRGAGPGGGGVAPCQRGPVPVCCMCPSTTTCRTSRASHCATLRHIVSHLAPCTLHIAHCTLRRTLRRTLRIAHCALHIAHCTMRHTLRIAHCTLHIASHIAHGAWRMVVGVLEEPVPLEQAVPGVFKKGWGACSCPSFSPSCLLALLTQHVVVAVRAMAATLGGRGRGRGRGSMRR